VGKAAALILLGLLAALGAPPAGFAQGDAFNEANTRGARLRLGGDLPGALREFNRVIELAPDSPIGWYNRGLVRRDQRDCRSAIEDFSTALQRDPRFFGAWYHRGNCRQSLGEFGAAMADYSRAIELPGRVDGRFLAYLARGDAARRSGEPERALADYTRVAELRTDTAVLHSRAWVNLYLGRWKPAFDDAARFLRDGEGKEPGSPYAALVAYIALRRVGERAKADAFLDEWSKRFDPKAWPAPVWRYLRGALDGEGLVAAAATAGEQTEARSYLGVGLLLSGDRGRGVEALEYVLERGDARYWEYDLAFYELKRLGLVSGAIKRSAP